MNADNIDQFLDSLAIGRTSRYSYAGTLRAFQAFVLERTPAGAALSLETVRAWLMHEAARSPLANVVHRAGVIARYLDWRTAAGDGANPLAALQDEYGRRLHPIIQALLEDDYEGALERLRPLPEFGKPARSAHVRAHRADAVTGIPVRGQGARPSALRSLPTAAPGACRRAVTGAARGLARFMPGRTARAAGAAVRTSPPRPCTGATRLRRSCRSTPSCSAASYKRNASLTCLRRLRSKGCSRPRAHSRHPRRRCDRPRSSRCSRWRTAPACGSGKSPH